MSIISEPSAAGWLIGYQGRLIPATWRPQPVPHTRFQLSRVGVFGGSGVAVIDGIGEENKIHVLGRNNHRPSRAPGSYILIKPPPGTRELGWGRILSVGVGRVESEDLGMAAGPNHRAVLY